MEICITSINYTTEKQHVHVFLDNLVKKISERGIKCNVIAPQSYYSFLFKKNKRRPLKYERKTQNGITYKIFSPLYVVYPRIKIGNICLSDKSRKSFYRALKRVYRKQKMHADLIYSHFIQAGISGVMLADELGIPSYIANGEADTINSVRNISVKLLNDTMSKVTGIISVSTKCKEEIRTLCDNDESIMKKVKVIPNAADNKIFHKMDREKCRNDLKLPKNKFIIAFTGSFIERKGVQKVAKAINDLDNVYALFIGTGPEEPTCKNILFKGRVSNKDMAKYLNAANVFVLPTLAEGCSNAIMEALACGLPIISSNLPFNKDVLDDTCSILISPEKQDEITNAIRELRDNPRKTEKLANGSDKKAKEYTLDKRVDKILCFMGINDK